MPDEKSTVTVDLRDEDEEWVQYARNQGRPHPDSELDDQSLEAASRRKLQQAVYQYLENLENNMLDISTLFELSRRQLLDELAGLVVYRAQNVKSIRDAIRDQLRSDKDVSAFELPQRTREATAKYLVETVVGKAEIRRMARLLLNIGTDCPAFDINDCSGTSLGRRYTERLRSSNY